MVSWDKGREEETGIKVGLGALKKTAELSTNRRAWGVVGGQGLQPTSPRVRWALGPKVSG